MKASMKIHPDVSTGSLVAHASTGLALIAAVTIVLGISGPSKDRVSMLVADIQQILHNGEYENLLISENSSEILVSQTEIETIGPRDEGGPRPPRSLS